MSWPVILIAPYFFASLIIFSGLLRSHKKLKKQAGRNNHTDRPAGQLTTITVICPFRDEEHNLPSFIKDLSNQDYPSELTEIILVDDHSGDNSLEIAKQMSNDRANMQVIESDKPGKKQSLNTALNAASGELIITGDADCRVRQGWLSSIEELYVSESPDLILGPVTLSESGSLLHRAQLLEFLSIQAVAEGSYYTGHPVMASGANLAFSRKLSKNYIDYIRPEIPSGDDMFMLQHALKNSMKISYNNNPDGVVSTREESTLSGFLRQRARWAGKFFSYTGFSTIAGGIITFSASLAIVACLALSLFNQQLFAVALLMYLVKGVADILILFTYLYIKKQLVLLKWFIAVEIFYPFYVLTVILLALAGSRRWKGSL
jgi:poly-beta-1,6-N-acetyl-D-glucosamine synthase